MEIIYKGTLYKVPVVSPTEISGARLYNLATQAYIEAKLTGGEDGASGSYGYEMELTQADTASIPQGVYNLELFSIDEDGNTIIQAYRENYAKVKETSFT